MPDEPDNPQSLPPISQQIELLLSASAEQAKPMLAALSKIKKTVALNQKTLLKYKLLWQKMDKQLAKSRKVFDKIVLSQKKMADKVKAATAKVMSQTKALRKQQQQMRQNVQGTKSYTSSLARLAVVGAGAFFGLRKLQEFVDTRFTVALNNGAQALERIASQIGPNTSSK